MSENTEASVGQILREAREARGMPLDDASMRLRLMQRQVEAMEADDFESLGQPVFARGFVRNYARLLGLVPDDLLARMQGAPAEPAAVSRAVTPQQAFWLTSPWLILLLLGLIVVVAVPVMLYLWLNSEADDDPGNRPPAAAQTQPFGGPEPFEASMDAGLNQGSAAPDAQAAPAATTTTPAKAGAPAAPEASDPQGVLRLEFGDESWVEIKDASGRMLHRQLNPAASSVVIRGQPPFDVVIGNAAQARITYNGRPIDLKPFTDVTVARFTLEE